MVLISLRDYTRLCPKAKRRRGKKKGGRESNMDELTYIWGVCQRGMPRDLLLR